MNRSYFPEKANYNDTLRKGVSFVRSLRGGLTDGAGSREERLRRLAGEIRRADAIVIGAGAGLSAAAGFTYSGERFARWFSDFGERFGFSDMYAGGFYPFPDAETRWAFWARNIYINRYVDPPKPVYRRLLSLTEGKETFVITTNVDHQFQRSGFDKERLFYTQGDYGLFQHADGSVQKTYDNEDWVMKAMAAQGFVRTEDGAWRPPEDRAPAMRLPSDLVPRCPDDGAPVSMNLRADDSFVEDAGWHEAAGRYAAFLREHETGRVLYLELGVGGNTPMIIKYPFWAMTAENPKAHYASLSRSRALCPEEIAARSICLDGDCGEALKELQRLGC